MELVDQLLTDHYSWGGFRSGNMTSAVLMAGYNNTREVEKYGRIVTQHYGETFIESGYKPLREFRSVVNNQTINKPLIQYTLERLFENGLIDEIIIVGHQVLLERHLTKFISKYDKPCRILSQNSKISDDIVRTFGIVPRKVKYNSVAGNLIKGYAASKACKTKEHALFVASDSPLTSNDFVNRFLELVDRYKEEADIIVPAIFMDNGKDGLGRPSLNLYNDSRFQLTAKEDEYGRQGFRLSSLLSANPYHFNINTANTAYSLRKCLSPNVQLKLFQITRRLGYRNVYSKYFLKKDLTITEVEEITSAYFGGRLKIIPMEGIETTYDYDGTDQEYRLISNMLSGT